MYLLKASPGDRVAYLMPDMFDTFDTHWVSLTRQPGTFTIPNGMGELIRESVFQIPGCNVVQL